MLYELSEKIYKLENEGKRVIRLDIGEPDWRPPESAFRTLLDSLEDGRDRYASAAGELELREKIAELHGCDARNVVITPGSKWGIFMLLKLHLKSRDNAIIFSPHWPAYELICKSLKANPRILKLKSEDNWRINFASLEDAIDSKTKIIILNSPCNPTSHAWGEREERNIMELASERGIPLLVDDAYRDLCFRRRKERQLGDNLLIANTFSKTFGMTGWRIGYIAVPAEIAHKAVKLNQITINNVSVFLQMAASKAIEEKMKFAEKVRKICKRRAEIAAGILVRRMHFTHPNAGLYLFPKLPERIDTGRFLRRLLENGIAVAPGNAFGEYKQHIRISLCKREEILKKALDKIVEVVEECE
ncbi:pyridoxal phosphate-dependent aminotransferase [Candidatus Micrarchaeota archaeon]|nr:pyridoxal phosphate-dependent aminotransferase [Candidatus Micrarchaeota archaeon]